jgi:thiol-disulfide isomerase/thioredoxin
MTPRTSLHLSCLFGLLLLCAQAQASVQWFTGTPQEALDASASDGKPVLLYFTATWCPSCQDLDRELLSTKAGAIATASHRAVKIDVDASGGEALVERFVVLAYPSALVFKHQQARGTELGRVVGFEGAEAWTQALVAVTDAAQSIEALRRAVEARDGDAPALLALGRALLERGHRREGEVTLQRVTLAWPTSDASAEALWSLGRYYHRVRREPAIAQHLWRELGERYAHTSWAYSAWSWYGKAQASLGQIALGASALEVVARRDLSRTTLLRIYGDYLKTHGLTKRFATARELISGVLREPGTSLDIKARTSLEAVRETLR